MLASAFKMTPAVIPDILGLPFPSLVDKYI